MMEGEIKKQIRTKFFLALEPNEGTSIRGAEVFKILDKAQQAFPIEGFVNEVAEDGKWYFFYKGDDPKKKLLEITYWVAKWFGRVGENK